MEHLQSQTDRSAGRERGGCGDGCQTITGEVLEEDENVGPEHHSGLGIFLRLRAGHSEITGTCYNLIRDDGESGRISQHHRIPQEGDLRNAGAVGLAEEGERYGSKSS